VPQQASRTSTRPTPPPEVSSGTIIPLDKAREILPSYAFTHAASRTAGQDRTYGNVVLIPGCVKQAHRLKTSVAEGPTCCALREEPCAEIEHPRFEVDSLSQTPETLQPGVAIATGDEECTLASFKGAYRNTRQDYAVPFFSVVNAGLEVGIFDGKGTVFFPPVTQSRNGVFAHPPPLYLHGELELHRYSRSSYCGRGDLRSPSP